jgi:hypothetical protein
MLLLVEVDTADAPVVLTMSAAATADVLLINSGVATEQLGALTAPDGLLVRAQLSATLPVKPPVGVIVIVEAPLAPGDAIVTPVLLSAKPGAATGGGTVTVKLVVSLIRAETPVNVTVYDPGLVVACVLMATVAATADVLVIDTGAATEQLGPSTAPAGPVTAHESVTVPVKPPLGVTVIVEVPLAPGEAMLTGVLVSAKLATGGFTMTATLV